MWFLLSGGLRRWVIFSLAVPVAARLLSAAGRRLETRQGATRLSRGLQGAGRLVETRSEQAKQASSKEARDSLRRWNR